MTKTHFNNKLLNNVVKSEYETVDSCRVKTRLVKNVQSIFCNL